MGTIAEKLTALKNTKQAICTELAAKGTSPGTDFSAYPDLISGLHPVNLADPVNGRTLVGMNVSGAASGGGGASGYGLVHAVEYQDGCYVLHLSFNAPYGSQAGSGSIQVSGDIYLNAL